MPAYLRTALLALLFLGYAHGTLFGTVECVTDTYIEPIVMISVGIIILSSSYFGAIWNRIRNVPPEAEPERDFYSRVRTFDDFVAGKKGKPPPAFFHKYSSASYSDLFRGFKRGVIGQIWKIASLSAIQAGMMEWAFFKISDCKIFDKPYAKGGPCEPNTGTKLYEFLSGVGSVQRDMLSLVSILLALYVNGRMRKHRDITYACWAFRGSLINLTCLIGGRVGNGSRVNLEYKFQLYRYLTILHFQVYQLISPEELACFDLKHWVEKGMMTEYEAHLLKGANSGLKVEMLVGWLAKLLTLDTVDEIKGMSEDMWMSLANMTVAIRGKASALVDSCAWLPPVSQPQLLTICNNLFIMVTPMSLVLRAIKNSQDECTKRKAWSIDTNNPNGINPLTECRSEPSYVWAMVGSTVMSMFFNGLMSLTHIVENPFGDDLDDLNEDALLTKTEYQVQTILLTEDPFKPHLQELKPAAEDKPTDLAEYGEKSTESSLEALAAKPGIEYEKSIGSLVSTIQRDAESLSSKHMPQPAESNVEWVTRLQASLAHAQ